MLLSIKNLAVTYGNNSNPTIAGVNLDLAEGEIVSIVGESGSGKTTVIRALLGVLPNTGRVSEGSITFDGQDLLGFSTKDWLDLRGNHIAMIFQDSGNMMNPIQTIGKQFVEFIQLHSTMSKQEAEAKAIEMLALTNLPHPHNIGVAAHMSDKIMVMKQGAVVEYGPAEEIIRNPQAEYTKQLLNAVPEIGGKRYV